MRRQPSRLYDDICEVLIPLWSADFGARLRLATLALAALADEAPRTRDRGSRRRTGHRSTHRGRGRACRREPGRGRATVPDRGPGLGGAPARRGAPAGVAAGRRGRPGRPRRSLGRDRRAVRRAGAPARGGSGPDPAGGRAPCLRRAGGGRAAGRRAPASSRPGWAPGPLLDELGSFRAASGHDGKLTPRERRDPGTRGGRSQQRRDRPAAVHLGQDRERARLQRDGQAGRRPAAPRRPRSPGRRVCSSSPTGDRRVVQVSTTAERGT